MKLQWRTALGGAAMLTLTACGGGDGSGSNTATATPDAATRMSAGLSDADKSFITDTAHGNYGEIAAAQVATRSSNAAVRDFAVKMIKDHSAMNNELAVLATKKGIEPPTNSGVTNSAENAYLKLLPGATFDSQYASRQVSDHQAVLQALQNEAATTTDSELRAFANKYIPIVRQHLTAAQALTQSVGKAS
ncbi:putative membrane protein [Arboricoccus pini]|uniref:Putative membrane protein n=1 Tax=Arboricoccus pini TaxID=1963835 RepID=A0A212RMS5_9PROT|nr:DUF4142 domain-containing protein [Arboricoccus pini]SNB73868.1 putative membrane protein [Arboricoccus pini]